MVHKKSMVILCLDLPVINQLLVFFFYSNKLIISSLFFSSLHFNSQQPTTQLPTHCPSLYYNNTLLTVTFLSSLSNINDKNCVNWSLGYVITHHWCKYYCPMYQINFVNTNYELYYPLLFLLLLELSRLRNHLINQQPYTIYLIHHFLFLFYNIQITTML